MNPNKMPSALFESKTKSEATYKVFEQATIYPKFIKIFKPIEPIDKLLPGMEERDKKTRIARSFGESNEDDIERSLRRTKQHVKDYARCNDFDLFATFTISPDKADRFNHKQCKNIVVNWIKNEQKRKGKFDYLVIPEFHKDKKALHFHCLFRNYPGKLIDSGKKINGRKSFQFKSYTSGWNSAVKIDNIDKVGSYVLKYIIKEMPVLFGQNRYYASYGLKKPSKIDNPQLGLEKRKPFWTFENEYGSVAFYLNVPALGNWASKLVLNAAGISSNCGRA